jgi:hypothetical protein
MSRQVRHRVTAVALAGALLGAPLLTNATAQAGQGFAGCEPGVFEPNCLLADESTPAQLKVPIIPSAAPAWPDWATLPDPLDADSALPDPIEDPLDPADAPAVVAARELPKTPDEPVQTDSATPSAGRKSRVLQGGRSRSAAASGAAATRRKTQTSTGTRAARSKSPGGASRVKPSVGRTAGAGRTVGPGVPMGGLARRATAAPGRVSAADEPLGAFEPTPERQPIGLLAVLAVVLALGIGIAAIRAFTAERAYQAMIP